MWELYDQLIAGIPADLYVDEYIPGDYFCFLRAGEYYGVTHSTKDESRPPISDVPPVGRALRDVAAGIKSWNFREASLGLAAINAWYNSRPQTEALGLDVFHETDTSLSARKDKNPLRPDNEEMRGKNVAVIGHFRYIEKTLSGLCNPHILERKPSEGDYPDSACEYLLPEMDLVYATGMTLINKTLPRLLELTPDRALFTLTGPSSPITPILFEHGVGSIAGFVVTDPEYVRGVIAGNCHGLFKGGRMVDYRPDTKA